MHKSNNKLKEVKYKLLYIVIDDLKNYDLYFRNKVSNESLIDIHNNNFSYELKNNNAIADIKKSNVEDNLINHKYEKALQSFNYLQSLTNKTKQKYSPVKKKSVKLEKIKNCSICFKISCVHLSSKALINLNLDNLTNQLLNLDKKINDALLVKEEESKKLCDLYIPLSRKVSGNSLFMDSEQENNYDEFKIKVNKCNNYSTNSSLYTFRKYDDKSYEDDELEFNCNYSTEFDEFKIVLLSCNY